MEGRFNGGVFALPVWGAYIWRGLFSEFYGNYIHVSDLLSFKCQLNEDLLEFFVHKVDAKLFKSIFLKNQRNKINVVNLEAFSFKQGGDSPVFNWNSGHKQTKNEQTQLPCEQRFLSGMAFCIKFF